MQVLTWPTGQIMGSLPEIMKENRFGAIPIILVLDILHFRYPWNIYLKLSNSCLEIQVWSLEEMFGL